MTVASNSAPVLHQLAIATVKQTAIVVGQAEAVNGDSVTPTTLICREDIAQTPGASRTNSLAMSTDFVAFRCRGETRLKTCDITTENIVHHYESR